MKYFLTLILILLFNLGIYPQDEIILIAHNNYLVGGTQNGKWLKEEKVLTYEEKTTKFFGFDSFKNTKPSEIYGTNFELGCGGSFFYFSNTAIVPEEKSEADNLKPILAIGTGAKWNLLPRVPKEINPANKNYQKTALDFLKTKKIKIKNVKLERIVSIDLEGDGTNEIFLDATSYKDENGELPSTPRAGDYSFVLMIKIINGKPKNFLLEGEFTPKKPKVEDYISEFDLSAFADLNGDGKMEVILKGFYTYGGDSTAIFESVENNLKQVLFAECGD